MPFSRDATIPPLKVLRRTVLLFLPVAAALALVILLLVGVGVWLHRPVVLGLVGITGAGMIVFSLIMFLLDLYLNRAVNWIGYIVLVAGMIWGTLLGERVTYNFGVFAGAGVDLDAETLRQADCVVIATAHNSYDWRWVVANSQLVMDTRNATKGAGAGPARVVKL